MVKIKVSNNWILWRKASTASRTSTTINRTNTLQYKCGKQFRTQEEWYVITRTILYHAKDSYKEAKPGTSNHSGRLSNGFEFQINHIEWAFKHSILNEQYSRQRLHTQEIYNRLRCVAKNNANNIDKRASSCSYGCLSDQEFGHAHQTASGCCPCDNYWR